MTAFRSCAQKAVILLPDVNTFLNVENEIQFLPTLDCFLALNGY